MYDVSSIYPQHLDCVKVEWNLGKRCNLDCSYCPAYIHDNVSPHTNIKHLIDAVDTLVELDRPVRISLTGGEPCVHPDVEELFEHIKQRCDWLSVTTNGTRLPDWYAEQDVDHYVFSLHFEDKVQASKVAENILLFTQLNENHRNIPFHINVMAHHKHMDRVRSAVTLFDSHNIKYAVRRIRWTEGDHNVFDDMKYDGVDLDWIMKQDATVKPNTLYDDEPFHANDIIKLHKNKFKGWSCNAGIESLMINWDGEVHRATCRVGGSLGNIYQGTFSIPSQPVVCTRDWCTCAADIPLSKKRP